VRHGAYLKGFVEIIGEEDNQLAVAGFKVSTAQNITATPIEFNLMPVSDTDTNVLNGKPYCFQEASESLSSASRKGGEGRTVKLLDQGALRKTVFRLLARSAAETFMLRRA
jgi:hypothetical protein